MSSHPEKVAAQQGNEKWVQQGVPNPVLRGDEQAKQCVTKTMEGRLGRGRKPEWFLQGGAG